MSVALDVRRAGDRAHTKTEWLDSWHSFSFGSYHDPANTGHGQLLVSNDDWVQAGSGFGMHHHRDMEIVTWVLSGRLEHRDSEGNHGELYPGLAQRMSAGTGIAHSEMNPSSSEAVHLVQMWVLPDTPGLPPSYEQRDVNGLLEAGGLQVIASGHGHVDAVSLHQRDATLWAGRLPAGATVAIPDGPHVHLFLAAGAATLDGAGSLSEGDAVRLQASGARDLTAGPSGAEPLIWVTA
jgi:redox-sensitive bicupin YhaK (pirin superfamily)